jgi:hypothetical protein
MTITLTFETTGEVRCPRRGEWFVSIDDEPKYADHNYKYADFEILRVVKHTQE